MRSTSPASNSANSPHTLRVGLTTCIFMILGGVALFLMGPYAADRGLEAWRVSISKEAYLVPLGIGACLIGAGLFVAGVFFLVRLIFVEHGTTEVWPGDAAIAEPELNCHRCGYDLRAQSADARCPECGTTVAESRKWAAISLRPAWRDSDPRWRRRVLVGIWILVLMPLMDILRQLHWTEQIPVPNVLGQFSTVHTLDDTLLCGTHVYVLLAFCIGVVLLFAKEGGRRPNRLDWTRRWGIPCGYIVLLLGVADLLCIGAMVLAGIACPFREPHLCCDDLILQNAAALEVRHGIGAEPDSNSLA